MKKLLTLILALTMLLSAVCFAENITADVATVTPAAEGETLKVCWIPICTGIDYFSPIAQGIEALCTELGMEYSTVAPDVANATSQIPYIETQIQNGVDILLIAPNSTDALKRNGKYQVNIRAVGSPHPHRFAIKIQKSKRC